MKAYRRFLLALSVLTIAIAGAVFPLFTDEVAYRLVLSRFLWDRFNLVYFFPLCPTAPSAAPSSWGLGLFLQSVIYGWASSPLGFRAISLVFTLGIYFWFYKLTTTSKASALQTLPSALLVGLLPLSFILGRPEQLITLVLLASISLYLLHAERRAAVALYQAAVCALALIILTLHPKTLFFTPFFLLLIFVGGWKKITTYIFGAWVTVTAFQSFRFYQAALSCENVGITRDKLNLALVAQQLDLSAIFSVGLNNLLSIVFPFLFQIFPTSADYPYFIFPVKLPFWASIIGNAAFCFVLVGFLVYLLSLCIDYGKILLRREGESPSSFVPLFFSGGILAQQFFQTYKNFYDSQHILPCLICLAILLVFSGAKGFSLFSNRLWIALSLTAVAVSQVIFIFGVSGELRSALKGEIPGGLESRYFVGALDPSRTEDAVLTAARNCGDIVGENKLRLILDDTTYLPLARHTREPLHASYVPFSWILQGEEVDLQKLEVDGVFVRCDSINQKIIGRFRSEAGYCCLR